MGDMADVAANGRHENDRHANDRHENDRYDYEDRYVPRARFAVQEPGEDMELSELFLQMGEAMYRLKRLELLAEARLRPLVPQSQQQPTESPLTQQQPPKPKQTKGIKRMSMQDARDHDDIDSSQASKQSTATPSRVRRVVAVANSVADDDAT